MSQSQRRFSGFVAVTLLAALLATLSSCSSTVRAQAGTPASDWSAAKERYVAGNYVKAIEKLDHLLEAPNEYSQRALPFSLVLTSGVAAGYIELADYYAAGARANRTKALTFLRKASDYRAMANHMVLDFAENTKKMDLMRGDSVQLAFGPPKGGAVEPALFKQIAQGMELSSGDEEEALSAAVDRGVLLAVCNVAGAPNNLAKASEILQRGEFLVRRTQFMKAVAEQLERESQLYARNKLDDSAKMAMLRQLAQDVLRDAPGSRTAMVTQVNGN
ncbi:MAG: hypothetical protein LAQ69_42205 [Acidobacteriia bacterium]|nr:hypothetical protein [Terriglobia bacterium]